MNKDEAFKLAVQLASGAISERELASEDSLADVETAIIIAYKAILAAYDAVPARSASAK